MTSSSPFNCETPNLVLKDVNRQEKDFFQKLEHSLFSEIGLNSWFKKSDNLNNTLFTSILIPCQVG